MVMDVMTILATVLALWSLIFSKRTYEKTFEHKRKKATLDAYNRLQKQAFDNLNCYKASKIEEIAKDSKSEEYRQISAYIARIEHFCVGINHEVYDFQILYEVSHGYFDGSIKNKIQPILNKKTYNGKEFYLNTKKVFADMEKETEKRNNKGL